MMNPFGPDARARRRLARLQRFADAFATSPTLPGNREEDGPLDRGRLPTAAIQLASDFIGQFTWPIMPQLVYRGVRTATRDEKTPAIEADAHVILSAHILTLTGCRREVELPIVVRQGRLLEPSVMVVDGVPRILSQSLVDEIVRQGTFKQKVDPRGGMFAPPLDQEGYQAFTELDAAFKEQDRFSRGMYSIASRKTAQARRREPEIPPYKEKPFHLGDRVTVDGDEAVVKECYPEGSSSYMFPHCKVDIIDGDKNVAVSIDRVKKARRAQQEAKEGDRVEMTAEDDPDRGMKGTVVATEKSRYGEVSVQIRWDSGETAWEHDWNYRVMSAQEVYEEHGQQRLPGVASRRAQRPDADDPVCPRCGGPLEGGRKPGGKDCMVCHEFVRDEDAKPWSPDTKYPAGGAPGFEDAPSWDDARPIMGRRRAQKFEPGARVTVAGEPARVIEQVHEPTGNGAWDGTYRVEHLDGSTEVVPESKVKVDSEHETKRHVEGQAQDDLDDDAPLSDREIAAAARWLVNKFGLTDDEARELAARPDQDDILRRVDAWQEASGLPAASSPLTRGYLLDQLKQASRQAASGNSLCTNDGACDWMGEAGIEMCPECGSPTEQIEGSGEEDLQPWYDSETRAGQIDQQAVSPPDVSEETIHELKRDPDVDNPFAVAWSIQKEKDKKGMREAAGASWPMPGEDVLETPTGRWQWIFDADTKRARYYHLECDGYAGRDGDCELCGAPSPSSPRYQETGKGVYSPRSGGRTAAFAVIRQEPAGYYVVHATFPTQEDADQAAERLKEQVANKGWSVEVRTQEVAAGTKPGARVAAREGQARPAPHPFDQLNREDAPSGPGCQVCGGTGNCSECQGAGCDWCQGGGHPGKCPRCLGDGGEAKVGAREGDGMPAEHNEDRKDNDFVAGESVEFTRSFRNRTRGGPSYLIDSGTHGKVVRDVAEDGTTFEVRLDNGHKVVVPRETLKHASRTAGWWEDLGPAGQEEYVKDHPGTKKKPGAPSDGVESVSKKQDTSKQLGLPGVASRRARLDGWHLKREAIQQMVPRQYSRQARATVDQVVREVEALKQEGYDDVDAMLAIHGKYPDLAEAVMQAARDKGLLDLDGE